MTNTLQRWIRKTCNNKPVYIDPEGPDWFVPNKAGDALIQELQNGHTVQIDSEAEAFLCQLDTDNQNGDYPGRSALLSADQLHECWFHITDRCNMACTHCLFGCSPGKGEAMSFELFETAFEQAFRLGARTFFLTGGEPLIHEDFRKIVSTILDKAADTKLVILTNGLKIPDEIDFLNTLPKDRIWFQVSMDGNEATHDKIRGKNAWQKMIDALKCLSPEFKQITLAMSVSDETIDQMGHSVETAAAFGISNIHYLWMLETGKAENKTPVPTERLISALESAHEKAEATNITIDNIASIENQIFSPQGTKHDLGNACWDSLAIGPDGNIYPTPAMIGAEKALGGNIKDSLETVWKTSERFNRIRSLSVIHDPEIKANPFRFLTGGGDMDQSLFHGDSFTGKDPYTDLYDEIALRCMMRNATNGQPEKKPSILLKMGDRLLSCDSHHGAVALTHSNCVLAVSSVHAGVSRFYSEAAETTNEDIVNPVCYPEDSISHIPETSRIRSYGCGSPVMDAALAEGETIVDLGSGGGMECFIAAETVGRTGKVIGIDMTDTMLALATKSRLAVEKNLGYSNIRFLKGFLEELPLADNTTDVVISNCVINLSGNKPRTFSEIFRILKPGGRIIISDIVTDTVPSPEILNDPVLRGECIAGALTQSRLFALLELAGFQNMAVKKRFFYREVNGHRFFSVTWTAVRPEITETEQTVIYPGPFASVTTDTGKTYIRGTQYREKIPENDPLSDQLFILDTDGNAANIDAENSCACYLPPEAQEERTSAPIAVPATGHPSGCMKCGSPLRYLDVDTQLECVDCGMTKPANAVCENGHFICDTCHSKDAETIVTDYCLNSKESDMIRLLNSLRNHPVFPLHGPDHHFAIPAAIVTAYRNLGGDVTDKDILSAIERGKRIPGGTCGFWGGCGAALGAGIAIGIILESNPVKAEPRKIVQQITGEIIMKISSVEASRCCQRESWTAMIHLSEISEKYLPVPMPVDTNLGCSQIGLNRECPGKACRFFKKPEKSQFQIL